MKEDRRIIVSEMEYEKLFKDGKANEMIINHPNFREAFLGAFFTQIGDENYRVDVQDDSIVIEKTGNYPDATNGVYHGFRDAQRCVFAIETKGDKEYLTVKQDGVSVFVFDGKEDEFTYSTQMTAYRDGQEVGFAQFSRNGFTIKGFNPLGMIYVPERPFSGSQDNPNLTLGNALTNTVNVPYTANNCTWRVNTARRDIDGIAYKTNIEHFNQFTEKSTTSYAVINTEHPERLNGNTTDFAISHSNSVWESFDGVILAKEDVTRLKQEYSEEYVRLVSGKSL